MSLCPRHHQVPSRRPPCHRRHFCRRFGRLEKLGLGDALTLELRADGKLPPRMLHALRILFGSAAELDDEKALKKPASIETEQRVWAALRSYCKLARNAMGGPLKADLSALDRERDPRRRLAIQFRAEKKRLLSKLENSLDAVAARSKKAGKPLKLSG